MTDHDYLQSIVARGLGYERRKESQQQNTTTEIATQKGTATAKCEIASPLPSPTLPLPDIQEISDASPSTKRDDIPSEQQTTVVGPTA